MFVLLLLLLLVEALFAGGNGCEKSMLLGKPLEIRTQGHSVVLYGWNCSIPVGMSENTVKVEVREYTIPKIHQGAVRGLPSLKVLQVEEDNVEEVEPGAFQDLPTTYNLSLANNKIRSIPDGVFQNVGVQILHLENNLIATISRAAFDNLADLQTIVLNNNRINTWIPFDFRGTPVITSIFMSHNLLRELPANAFEHFAQQKMDLVGVHLADNLIERVDEDVFSGFSKVVILHLDSNRLQSVRFGGDVKFEFLFLQNNSIGCLDQGFVRRIQNYLDLGENPFTCDCIGLIDQWKANERISINFKQTNPCV